MAERFQFGKGRPKTRPGDQQLQSFGKRPQIVTDRGNLAKRHKHMKVSLAKIDLPKGHEDGDQS